jgi:hypothetical protein
MRTSLLLLAFLLTVPGAMAAQQGKPPNFDIQRNCREEAADTGNIAQTKDECVRAEGLAKNQLEQRWSTLKPSEETRQCLEESSIGGDQSYVELQTCLDMSNAWPGNQSVIGQGVPKAH